MNQIVFGFFAEFLHVAPPHLPDHVHNDVHDKPKEGSSIDLHEIHIRQFLDSVCEIRWVFSKI